MRDDVAASLVSSTIRHCVVIMNRRLLRTMMRPMQRAVDEEHFLEWFIRNVLPARLLRKRSVVPMQGAKGQRVGRAKRTMLLCAAKRIDAIAINMHWFSIHRNGADARAKWLEATLCVRTIAFLASPPPLPHSFRDRSRCCCTSKWTYKSCRARATAAAAFCSCYLCTMRGTLHCALHHHTAWFHFNTLRLPMFIYK